MLIVLVTSVLTKLIELSLWQVLITVSGLIIEVLFCYFDTASVGMQYCKSVHQCSDGSLLWCEPVQWVETRGSHTCHGGWNTCCAKCCIVVGSDTRLT